MERGWRGRGERRQREKGDGGRVREEDIKKRRRGREDKGRKSVMRKQWRAKKKKEREVFYDLLCDRLIIYWKFSLISRLRRIWRWAGIINPPVSQGIAASMLCRLGVIIITNEVHTSIYAFQACRLTPVYFSSLFFRFVDGRYTFPPTKRKKKTKAYSNIVYLNSTLVPYFSLTG